MKKSPFPTYPKRNPKFFFMKISRVCDGRICDISYTTTMPAKTIIYSPTNTVPVSLTDVDLPIPRAPTTQRIIIGDKISLTHSFIHSYIYPYIYIHTFLEIRKMLIRSHHIIINTITQISQFEGIYF